MAELRMEFEGLRGEACASYGFVVRTEERRIGRGWGAGGGYGDRRGAALVALERGLEFLLSVVSTDRSIETATSCVEAVDALLRPPACGAPSAVPREVVELIDQFGSLRIRRVEAKGNHEPLALAKLAAVRFELRQRTFEVSDDADGADSPTSLPPEGIRLLDRLRWREREMIKLHTGLYGGGPRSFAEIGRVFRLSGTRIGQIVDQGLRRLWTIASGLESWPPGGEDRDEARQGAR